MKLTSKSINKYALIMLSLASSLIYAHPKYRRNTYLDQKISAGTLTSFIQPLPEDAAPVMAWIHKHLEQVRYLAATPHPLSSWDDKKVSGKEILAAYSIANKGSNNFVFKLPGTDWWIKISGPLRRLINLYVYNTGNNPFERNEYAIHHEFSNRQLFDSFEIVPTFGTISRFANSLLCQDVLMRNNINKVYFPEIYLLHIPGNPTDISDDNYIIVEKEVRNIENICNNPRSSDGLTKKGIEQLYKVITQAGIFDFNGENLRIDNDNNLVFIDLEQGIVEDPTDFYNKNKEMFDFRVYSGIKTFYQARLEKNSKEYAYLKSLIIDDQQLKESAFWPRFKRLFRIKTRLVKKPGALQKSTTIKKSHRTPNLVTSVTEYTVDTKTIAQTGNRTCGS